MLNHDIASVQLHSRTRVFQNRALDQGWDDIVRVIYESRPDLDSARNLFIRLNNGLGDIVCTLGLMSAWKRHYCAKNVIAIATRSSAGARKFFPGALDFTLEIDDEPRCGEYRGGSVFGVLHRPTKPYVFGGILEPWFTRLRVPYLDRYRLGLQLPPWAEFQPPEVDQLSAEIDNDIVRELSGAVVIAPFARTIPGPSRETWIDVVAHLSREGIRVFTNMTNTVNTVQNLRASHMLDQTKPIEGSEGLHCNLSTLLAAAQKLRAVVTTNSGIAWLVGNTAAKTIVLHPNFSLPAINNGNHGFSSSAIIELDSIKRSFPWAPNIIDMLVEHDLPKSLLAKLI